MMSLKHFLPQHSNRKSFLRSWTKRVKNFVSYPVQCAKFLTHKKPLPRIWYRYGPSPHPTLVKVIRSGSEMIQSDFGEEGPSAFKSFILKLDIATSIFLKLHLPVITAVSFWSWLILGIKSFASDSKAFPRLSLPGAALKFVLWRKKYQHNNKSVHLFTRTSAVPN